MKKIFQNTIEITSVFLSEKRQYGFGILLEPEPRAAYIPHTVINSFGLTMEDIGQRFFCFFMEPDEAEDNPKIISLSEDQYDLKISTEACLVQSS